MNQMINYYCPDFFNGQKVYDFYFQLKEKHPEIFYENTNIKKIYGCFNGMIWNGGGVQQGWISLESIKYIKDYYEDLNIPLQLTLTNPLLTKEDCYDRYCNKVLEIMNNGLNEILISSEILEEYIKKEFPEYLIDRSIIAANKNDLYKNIDYLKMLEQYNMIVLPREKINDVNFLTTIPFEKRNRFEILCNDPCPVHCPRIYSHYEDYAKITLYEDKEPTHLNCIAMDRGDVVDRMKYQKYIITYDKILNDFLPLGYNEFKISGRGSEFTALTTTVRYLIKPEHQLNVVENYLLTV